MWRSITCENSWDSTPRSMRTPNALSSARSALSTAAATWDGVASAATPVTDPAIARRKTLNSFVPASLDAIRRTTPSRTISGSSVIALMPLVTPTIAANGLRPVAYAFGASIGSMTISGIGISFLPLARRSALILSFKPSMMEKNSGSCSLVVGLAFIMSLMRFFAKKNGTNASTDAMPRFVSRLVMPNTKVESITPVAAIVPSITNVFAM